MKHRAGRAPFVLCALLLPWVAAAPLRAQVSGTMGWGSIVVPTQTFWEARPADGTGMGPTRALVAPRSGLVRAGRHPFPQVESRPNRVRGALLGGGIGLVAGGILGGLSVTSDGEGDLGGDFGGGLGDAAATGTAVMLGAVFGAGIGALLGATVFAPSRGPKASSDVAGAHSIQLVPRVTPRSFAMQFSVQ